MTNYEIKHKAKENMKLCWGNQAAISCIGLLASILPLVNAIVGGPASLSVEEAFYKVSTGEKVEFKSILNGFKKSFGPAFLANALISAFVTIGCFFFFIPGIILRYCFSMTYYIMVREPELDGNEAMKKSRKMMSGHKLRFFLLELSFIGWFIIALFSGGLLFAYVAPYICNSFTLLQNEIYDNYHAEAPRAVFTDEDSKFCRYCGEKIPGASQFCPNCGRSLINRE